MNASDLVENWLKGQGFKSERVGDGDLLFRYQGVHMLCRKDDDDKVFLRLFMPGIYTVNGDRTRVLEAINTISRDIKAVKAFLVEDKLWVSLEMFIDSTPDIDDFIERCLDIMYAAFKQIGNEILG
ncbi:MAG: hypothetical protein MJZ20_00260 [Bacteroidaceae bacterium]|nr:hypothetical protein [Bacteroidaceae bacterium]